MPSPTPPDLDLLERGIVDYLERCATDEPLPATAVRTLALGAQHVIAHARRLQALLDHEAQLRLYAWLGPCLHGRSPITRCEEGCDEMVGSILEGWALKPSDIPITARVDVEPSE